MPTTYSIPNIILAILFIFYSKYVMAQNGIEDEFETTTTTQFDEETTTMKPPADPFTDIDDISIDDKLDELDKESQEIVIDYIRNGRKLYGDLRRRLILYVMKFSPVQTSVEVSGTNSQIQKIEKIKYRFRSGMKIKYSSLKSRIDKLVAHLLAPIFAPFMLLQPAEIRPLYFSQQPKPTPDNRFVEAISIPQQQISDQQSSFTALEVFPSSLPQNKWPQFDAKWMNPPSTQFSVPSFTPFYQPFQYYRAY